MSAATLLAVLKKHPFVDDFQPEHIGRLEEQVQ